MAKEALSFMYLGCHQPDVASSLVYISRAVDQCQICRRCLHIRAGLCVTGSPKKRACEAGGGESAQQGSALWAPGGERTVCLPALNLSSDSCGASTSRAI